MRPPRAPAAADRRGAAREAHGQRRLPQSPSPPQLGAGPPRSSSGKPAPAATGSTRGRPPRPWRGRGARGR
eukprot:scaffold87554_cov69-Phaeocystis_antarctica.AAC.2